MAKRYTAGLFATEWGNSSTAQVVIVEDVHIRDTGLVDRYGVPIKSYEEQQPVGFYRLKEKP